MRKLYTTTSYILVILGTLSISYGILFNPKMDIFLIGLVQYLFAVISYLLGDLESTKAEKYYYHDQYEKAHTALRQMNAHLNEWASNQEYIYGRGKHLYKSN